MFKELFAIAASAPVLLLVSREGDKLRMNLTRKGKDEDDEKALAISVLATPEELDRDLPGVLADGLKLKTEEAATSVADQVKGQLEASGTKKTKVKAAVKARKAAKPVTPKVVRMKGGAKSKTAKPTAAPKKKPSTKKAKGALLTPTPALAAVIGGAAPLAFNDAMAKVWAYIKAHDLKEKRNGKPHIRADDAMKAVLGGAAHASVSDLPKLVKAQFTETSQDAKNSAPAAKAPKARRARALETPTPVITPLLTPEKLAQIVERPDSAATHVESPPPVVEEASPPPTAAVPKAEAAPADGELVERAAVSAKPAVDDSTPDLF